jgi:hypothetical protein
VKLSSSNVLLLALCVALVPIRRTIVESWTVLVVDMGGQPVAGVSVAMNWTHYSFAVRGDADLVTASDGMVTFPRAVRTYPMAYWGLRRLLVAINVHGSSGTYAMVRAIVPSVQPDPGFLDSCSDETCRRPLKSTLVARLSKEGALMSLPDLEVPSWR